MRILIIANPTVAIDKKKRAILERIMSRVTDRGGTFDITYSMKAGMGSRYSSMAPFEGYDAVFAAGGDGTINDIASGLVGSNIPLGIIPLGTGNGFARGLNLSLEERNFTEVLMAQKTELIDVGKISAHYFFTTAGIGFDAHIAREFNLDKTPGRSITRYVFLAFKNYLLTGAEKVTINVDGKELNRRIFGLTIANMSQYGSGAIIAPQAGPKSGKLVAVLIPRMTVFKALTAIKKLFDGTANKIKDLEFIEFENLKIKRSKGGYYHADGETYKGDVSLNVSVLPSSLRVIVP